MYRVHLGGRRWRRFTRLVDACRFCNEVHKRTGVVLSITLKTAKGGR